MSTPNKVLEKLRMFGGQYKNADASSHGSDWPEPGSHITLFTGVNAREMPLKISKTASVPGFLVSLKFQLVDDPERETPRTWSDAFRFFAEADYDQLPEANQQGANYDRDRFYQFLKVFTGNDPIPLAEAVELLTTLADNKPVIRQKITAKPEGTGWKYQKGYPQELIPS
jgi:hypothetical protein